MVTRERIYSKEATGLKAVMPDESDRMVYEVAKHCNAWLVTGNQKHFPDDGTAVSPAEFLNTMK